MGSSKCCLLNYIKNGKPQESCILFFFFFFPNTKAPGYCQCLGFTEEAVNCLSSGKWGCFCFWILQLLKKKKKVEINAGNSAHGHQLLRVPKGKSVVTAFHAHVWQTYWCSFLFCLIITYLGTTTTKKLQVPAEVRLCLHWGPAPRPGIGRRQPPLHPRAGSRPRYPARPSPGWRPCEGR